MADTPDLAAVLARRIRLVRRDLGGLLFHFTRTPDAKWVKYTTASGGTSASPASASAVLWKILHEGTLLGSDRWSAGRSCVCFTEAPIQELVSVFSLIEIAASQPERPRYEPYGIAVSKEWLYAQGGRPVIYDSPDAEEDYPDPLRYRFVPYTPGSGPDFTWEREWRIQTPMLTLDPRHTLVVVPTADEAFEITYGFADLVPDYDDEPTPTGAYHQPSWLTVSLDLFGLKFDPESGLINEAGSPGVEV